MDRRTSLRIAAPLVATLALGALVGSAPVAAADREREGDCSARSDWELELEKDDGRIEFDLDIDTPRSGQRWAIVIKQNGGAFFENTRRTDDDGDIEIDRDRPDRSGTDRFSFRAVNRVTGEVCAGGLSIGQNDGDDDSDDDSDD
jgi:hypothetical protein